MRSGTQQAAWGWSAGGRVPPAAAKYKGTLPSTRMCLGSTAPSTSCRCLRSSPAALCQLQNPATGFWLNSATARRKKHEKEDQSLWFLMLIRITILMQQQKSVCSQIRDQKQPTEIPNHYQGYERPGGISPLFKKGFVASTSQGLGVPFRTSSILFSVVSMPCRTVQVCAFHR